jgi:chromosome partitioning protein
MTAICLVNRKGGVGKTSLTLALADFLTALHGRKVLIVDIDPQANASLALLGEQRWLKQAEQDRRTVADIFLSATTGKLSEGLGEDMVIEGIRRIKGTARTIALLPGTPRLQEVEEDMMEGDSEWRYFLGSPYFILSQAVVKRLFPRYDYVLIDCPPALGMTTLNGLTAANGYLIPTIADHVSTVGIDQVIGRIQRHAKGLRRELRLYGTLVNRFKRATSLHRAVLAELRNRRACQPVWDTIIPDTVKAEEGYLFREHLFHEQMTLKGRYGGETHNYYQALIELAEEFLRRIP